MIEPLSDNATAALERFATDPFHKSLFMGGETMMASASYASRELANRGRIIPVEPWTVTERHDARALMVVTRNHYNEITQELCERYEIIDVVDRGGWLLKLVFESFEAAILYKLTFAK